MNKVIVQWNKVSGNIKLDVDDSHPIGKDIYEDKNNTLEVSDGHHTMTELYNHRHTLFCALCKIYDNYITPLRSRVTCWKSKLHDDGTMFEGWFIAGMTVKQFDGTSKNLTYHLPLEWWDKFKVMELPNAPAWDGHTSDDVLVRLMEL